MDGRIDPPEERRRREVMDAFGVYDAHWALCKAVENSDVEPGQNRLLITKVMAQEGPLPKMFPELEQLDDDGKNAQNELNVPILSEDGVEKAAVIRFLNSNKAYRIKGPEWREFVEEGGFSRGDRLDVYTCKRGDDGERCLFFFKSKGGGGSPRSNARKRSRQQPAAIRDSAAAGDVIIDGGNADNGNGTRDANGGTARDSDRRATNTRCHAGDRIKDHKRAKNGGRLKKEDTRFVIHDSVLACTGDSQGDRYRAARSSHDTHYECCKAETTGEEAAAWRLWGDATSPVEKEAAEGLLLLKFATYAEDN